MSVSRYRSRSLTCPSRVMVGSCPMRLGVMKPVAIDASSPTSSSSAANRQQLRMRSRVPPVVSKMGFWVAGVRRRAGWMSKHGGRRADSECASAFMSPGVAEFGRYTPTCAHTVRTRTRAARSTSNFNTKKDAQRAPTHTWHSPYCILILFTFRFLPNAVHASHQSSLALPTATSVPRIEPATRLSGSASCLGPTSPAADDD